MSAGGEKRIWGWQEIVAGIIVLLIGGAATGLIAWGASQSNAASMSQDIATLKTDDNTAKDRLNQHDVALTALKTDNEWMKQGILDLKNGQVSEQKLLQELVEAKRRHEQR